LLRRTLADRLAERGRGGVQAGVALAPDLGLGAETGEVVVLDREQAALLEVGRGEAPAAGEIAVEVVGEHAPEGALDGFAGAVEDLGVLRVEAHREVEGVKDPLGELVVGDPAVSALDGALEGALEA
jgi:hypothetical protein